MKIASTATHLDLLGANDTLAGRYQFADAFKPHFHPLQTPRGHNLTLVSPHDHKHHKGLMFALRTAEFNFWEEANPLPGQEIGHQRHVAFVSLIDRGDEVGFTEQLQWEAVDGGPRTTFTELRTVRCRESQNAFAWSWESELTAVRDAQLILSEWSHKQPDGSLVNYHGLGIRFRREFGGGTSNNALALDGEAPHWNRWPRYEFTSRMGAQPQSVRFIGSLDGYPMEQASVTFIQPEGQNHALYIFESGFAFMSLGPSNLAPVTVRVGEKLTCRYTIRVADEL